MQGCPAEVCRTLKLDDVVLAYTRATQTGEVEPGYLEDETVRRIELPNIRTGAFRSRMTVGKVSPQAGKALSGKKCEVRVQFNAPTATSFDGDTVPPNGWYCDST